MQSDESMILNLWSKGFTEAVIRLGLIALLLVLCVRIFAPFADLILWALILAISLYPLHRRLAKRLGGRQGCAAMLLIMAGVLLIGVPTVILVNSFGYQVRNVYTLFVNNDIAIKPPDPSVGNWPLIGKKVLIVWSAAADNLPGLLEENKAQLMGIAKRVLVATASTAGAVLVFLGSLVISGIMMAYGETGSTTMQCIFNRLAGASRGGRLLSLSTATIRSVANGVIGVAFIQSLLLGVGFMMAGIPAPGVLALIVLFLGIVQLPAAIVSLPAIVYLWWAGDASTAINIFYTVCLILAGMADNVLKPLLLGRGVEAPMPVILLGAMGGMVSGGIIGLFVGAVLLAVGYRVFMDWVDNVEISSGVTLAK